MSYTFLRYRHTARMQLPDGAARLGGLSDVRAVPSEGVWGGVARRGGLRGGGLRSGNNDVDAERWGLRSGRRACAPHAPSEEANAPTSRNVSLSLHGRPASSRVAPSLSPSRSHSGAERSTRTWRGWYVGLCGES